MVQAFTDKNRTSLLVYIFRSIPILVGICALVAKNNRCHLRFVCVDYCIQIGRFIRYTSQLIRPPFPDLLDRGNSLAECQHAASESTLFGWPDLMNVRVHRSRAPSSCVMYCASHRERVLSVTPGWPPPQRQNITQARTHALPVRMFVFHFSLIDSSDGTCSACHLWSKPNATVG